MLTFRKVLIWVSTFLLGVSLVMGLSTTLQMLPYVALVTMGFLSVYGKRETQLRIPILVLSAVMVLVNLSGEPAFLDVLVWACALVAFYKE